MTLSASDKSSLDVKFNLVSKRHPDTEKFILIIRLTLAY